MSDYVITDQTGRIDKVLTTLEPEITRSQLKNLINDGHVTVNGQAPQVFQCVICGDQERPAVFSPAKGGIVCSECSGDVIDGMILDNSTLYSMQYIESTPVVKLYTFTVAENVLAELEKVMDRLMEVYVDRRFKSLEILETLT